MTPSAMTATQAAEFRAAGTDLSERRRSGISTGPLIDIAATPDMIGMHWGTEGSLRIGAFTTIAAIANAILNATGVRPTELPIRPDRLVAALKGRAAA